MSKVSIILTSYNHEKFIAKAIKSILNQTFTDYELIIIDDCSNDKSWEIINGFDDCRIHAIRNPKNIRSEGIYRAIRTIASGEYIAMHHSDDLWEPTKLEKQVEFMEKNHSYGACFTQVNVIDEEDNVYTESGFYKNVFNQPNRNRYEWLNYFFYEGNALCHPSILIRKEMYQSCGLFDYGFANIPDFYKWIKLCMHHDIYIYPEKLTYFRILNNERNTSGDKPEGHIRFSIEIYQVLKHYLELTCDEFLKVFPNAMQYVKDKKFVKEFAFARILIDTSDAPAYCLLGYTLLFSIVNDMDKAKLVENLYGYSYLDLIKETGKKDIFSVIPKERYMQSSLYVDYGNGYSEENKISTALYLSSSNKFFVDFDLTELNEKNDLKLIHQLRFDPNENYFILCKIQEVIINGKPTVAKPYNAYKSEDNKDYFLSTDPNYLINDNLQGAYTVQIIGSIEPWNGMEVSETIQSMYLKLISSEGKLKVLIQENEQQKISILQQQKNYNELNRFYDKLKDEYCQLEHNYNQQVEWTSQLSRDYSILQLQNQKLQNENYKLTEEVIQIKSRMKQKYKFIKDIILNKI